MKEVLLFNKCANGPTAARVHSSNCKLVDSARKSKGKVQIIDCPNMGAMVADLNARGWLVRWCRCTGVIA